MYISPRGWISNCVSNSKLLKTLELSNFATQSRFQYFSKAINICEHQIKQIKCRTK